MAAWANAADAARLWPESATLDPATLGELLDTAQHRLTAYAPELGAGEPAPPTYTHAVILDARDLWAARIVTGDASDALLAEGYTLRLRRGPSHQVRELLRPTRPAVAR